MPLNYLSTIEQGWFTELFESFFLKVSCNCKYADLKGLVNLSADTNETHSSGTVSHSRWKKIWGCRIFATL